MTIAYLHLIRLSAGVSAQHFAQLLRQHAGSYRFDVVLFSRFRHAVASAQVVDKAALDAANWDCMAFLQPTAGTDVGTAGGSALPNSLAHLVRGSYSVRCAVSSALLAGFAARNAALHGAAAVDGRAFDGSRLQELRRRVLSASSQRLEADPDLLAFAARLLPEHGLRPVTMLNLLRFNDGKQGLDSYKEYGARFRQVGGKRGGDAKIVGKVLGPARVVGDVPAAGSAGEKWDELAIVHYPNMVAFCDLAAGDDYQEINKKYRLPALRDTLLFASLEIPLAASSADQVIESEVDLPSKL